MRTNILLVAVATFLSFSSLALAGEEVAEKSFEVSFSSKVFSQYVGDTGTVFYNRAVSQNDLTISHKSGVYLDVWTSTSLKNAGVATNYGNEVDYTLGWAGEISGVGIDAGVSYWDLVKLFEMPEGDIVQPYLELNKKVELAVGHTLTPSVKAEYGIPAKGNDPLSKGLHVHGALKHGWEISKHFSLNQKAVLTYDDGAYGASRALVGAYEFAPTVKLTSWLSLEGSAKVIGPLSQVDDGRKAEYIFAGGFSTSF